MAAATEPFLPPEFADLEPWARVWAIESMNGRYAKRHASTMAEMRAFYEAVVPRGPAVIDHLERFPLDDMPEPELRLLWMMASLSTISFCVDVFKQPKIPSAGDANLPYTVEFRP